MTVIDVERNEARGRKKEGGGAREERKQSEKEGQREKARKWT